MKDDEGMIKDPDKVVLVVITRNNPWSDFPGVVNTGYQINSGEAGFTSWPGTNY